MATRALIGPVLTVEPIPDAVPDLTGVQALVLTSANAVPALAATDPGRPVFVIGAATARAARAAGCRDVRPAAGDGASLARLIIEQCRPERDALLHLAGTEVRPELAEALAAAGFELRRQAVYRVVAADRLAAPVVEAIRARAIDAVLLFSPRSAATFVELIARHDLAGVSWPNRGNLPQRGRRGALSWPGLGGGSNRPPTRHRDGPAAA